MGPINIDVRGIAKTIAIAAFVFGVLAAQIVPWLWALVKPLIHSATS